MAFKDILQYDIEAVFLNLDELGEDHTWDGKPLRCVVDEETALKRKNNNVVDLSWDNNTMDKVLYCSVEGFPGRPVPNTQHYFDDRPYRILQVQDDMGVYTIVLAATLPRTNMR